VLLLLFVKNGKRGLLEDGELESSTSTFSSSAVTKDSSVFSRNRSLVEGKANLDCSEEKLITLEG